MAICKDNLCSLIKVSVSPAFSLIETMKIFKTTHEG